MNVQKIWKNIINRYSYNFLAIIGLGVVIYMCLFLIILLANFVIEQIISENIQAICNNSFNISDIKEGLLTTIFFSTPLAGIVLSLVSALTLIIVNSLNKKTIFKPFTNPFKSILTTYTAMLLVFYMVLFISSPLLSMPEGSSIVLLFLSLKIYPIIATIILCLYIMLVLFELDVEFRIDRKYFKETKYYGLASLFGFLISAGFVVFSLMIASQLQF